MDGGDGAGTPGGASAAVVGFRASGAVPPTKLTQALALSTGGNDRTRRVGAAGPLQGAVGSKRLFKFRVV